MNSPQRPVQRKGEGPRRRRLIFLCTGNSCRSPMAEHLLKSQLGPEDGWDVLSAGTLQIEGAPASDEAVAVLREVGIDLSGHRSRPATYETLRDADLIVAMASHHVEYVRHRHPELAGKVKLFCTFDPAAGATDVPDPVGMPVGVYRETLRQLRNGMPGLLAKMRKMLDKGVM